MDDKVTMYHYRVIESKGKLEVQVRPLIAILKVSPYNNERLYYTVFDNNNRSYLNVDKLDTLLPSTLSMYSLSSDKTKWFIDMCYCDKLYKFNKLKKECVKLDSLVNKLLVLANKIEGDTHE